MEKEFLNIKEVILHKEYNDSYYESCKQLCEDFFDKHKSNKDCEKKYNELINLLAERLN